MATPSIGPNRQANNTGYEVLYENIEWFPEMGHFRRFAALWAKLIHDNTRDVIDRREDVFRALRHADPSLRKADVLSIPRHEVKKKYGKSCERSWMAYEKALRQYGRDLCMSSQIMQLPEQAAWATGFLKKCKEPIFVHTDILRFGLTQEDAQEYLSSPEGRDACTWKESSDPIAAKVAEWAPWFARFMPCLLRRDGKKSTVGRNEPPSEESVEHKTEGFARPSTVDFAVIVRVIDVFICTGICILLMSVIFVLESIPRPKTRIGTTGALGTVFSVLVMLLAGPTRRIEVYAATVAFFAIACEFLSVAGSGGSGH